MTCYSRVTDTGDIIVPAQVARALGLLPGDMLSMAAQGSEIVVKSYGDIVREGQRAFRATIKRPFTLDEFLAERHAEAAAE